MDTNFQDKEKVIYYLSVIRDAEVNKPPQEMEKELIDASVGLLLYLQDKNDNLTPEQINDAVEKIPFVDKEKIVNIKNKNKKINKLKLLLIAAIIPIILTILVLMATADTEWLHFDTLKELFQSVASTPAGETFYKDDTEFGRVDGNIYSSPEEFAKNYDIDILVPPETFTKENLVSISYMPYAGSEEVYLTFENENFTCTIYLNSPIPQDIYTIEFEKDNINGFDCYIIELSDIDFYQVYFNHNGHTYCFNHSDLDVIIDLIENMEEIK